MAESPAVRHPAEHEQSHPRYVSIITISEAAQPGAAPFYPTVPIPCASAPVISHHPVWNDWTIQARAVDGQAATSRWFGVEDDARLADAIIAGGGLAPIEQVSTGVDLAPSSGKIDSVAHELRPTQGGQLRKVLAEHEDHYDFAVIDCPPSLGNRLIGNALLAASHALVPVETSILALDGLRLLLTMLGDVRDGFDHDIRLLGVLACRYDGRTRLSRLVLGEMQRALPGYVCETTIRACIRLQECPATQTPIFTYAPQSSAADDYRALAAEVIAGGPTIHADPEAINAAQSAYAELDEADRQTLQDFRKRACNHLKRSPRRRAPQSEPAPAQSDSHEESEVIAGTASSISDHQPEPEQEIDPITAQPIETSPFDFDSPGPGFDASDDSADSPDAFAVDQHDHDATPSHEQHDTEPHVVEANDPLTEALIGPHDESSDADASGSPINADDSTADESADASDSVHAQIVPVDWPSDESTNDAPAPAPSITQIDSPEHAPDLVAIEPTDDSADHIQTDDSQDTASQSAHDSEHGPEHEHEQETAAESHDQPEHQPTPQPVADQHAGQPAPHQHWKRTGPAVAITLITLIAIVGIAVARMVYPATKSAEAVSIATAPQAPPTQSVAADQDPVESMDAVIDENPTAAPRWTTMDDPAHTEPVPDVAVATAPPPGPQPLAGATDPLTTLDPAPIVAAANPTHPPTPTPVDAADTGPISAIPFDTDMNLTGTISNVGAIIDGRIIPIGHTHNGAKLVAVDHDVATLEYEGQRYRLAVGLDLVVSAE